MIGRLRLLILTLLLIVAVSPVFAQSTPALTQSVKKTSDDGLTLTTSFPADWAGASDESSVFVASSATALNEIKSTGTLKTPGATAIVVYLPSFLDHVNLAHDAPPMQAISAYLQQAHINSTPQTSTDFPVPAVTAPITDSASGLKGILGALGFPDGTVVFGVLSPDGSVDATSMAILKSITLTSASDQIAAQSTEPSGQAAPLNPTSFNERTPNDGFETFSVGLPDGWVVQHDTAGLIYLANSQAVLDKITGPNNSLSPGEVGLSIVLPPALGRLGIDSGGSPENVMREFESSFHVSGVIQSDSSFPEDTVYLHLVGDKVPSGGGIAYALAFDNSAMFVIVQPESAFDATTLAILRSISLTPGMVAAPTTSPNTSTYTVPDTVGSDQISIALPDGWVSQDTHNGTISFANSQDALTRMSGTSQPGDVAMVLFAPVVTRTFGIHFDTTPEDAVKAVESNFQVSGDVHTDNSFVLPAASALVTGSGVPKGGGEIYAIKYDAGMIVLLIQPATGIDAALKHALQSIQLHAIVTAATPEVTAEATAEPTAEATTEPTAALTPSDGVTPTSFNDTDPQGNSYQVSITLPEGWLSQDYQNDALFFANTQDALTRLLNQSTPQGNDIQLTLFTPQEMESLGVSNSDTPEDAIKQFETTVKGTDQFTADVHTDDSFSIPAAYGSVDVPSIAANGVVVYALRFDTGIVLAIVNPPNGLDSTLMATLHSIQYSGSAVTPEATSEVSAAPTEATSEVSALSTAFPQSASLTPVAFNLSAQFGGYQVSIGLPAGWVSQNPQNGLLEFANSADALARMGGSTIGLSDMQVFLFSPITAENFGITDSDTPEDALRAVQSSVPDLASNKSDIQTDTSFGVPAAHVLIIGPTTPSTGLELYALKLDVGMVIVLVEPAGGIDDALVAALHSIQFTAPAVSATPEPTAAPTAEATAAPIAAPTAVTAESSDLLRQWAVKADGSSEYSDSGWNFKQATGKPDTTTCDDNSTAWASQSSTERAYLKVTFAHPVIPSQINIYQSFNPGAIVEVDLGNSANPDKVLPLSNSADAPGNTPCLGYFSLNVTGVDTPVDFVVIYVDQSITGNWDEIDAVQLVGTNVN